ncbi:MAG: hypothetical protein H5T33_05590 [Candidatus Methanosuratus sp.]|nr:hypothetical protein [Candidatus Methanosuratincola sp.]
MRQVGQTLSMGFAMMVLSVYVWPVQISPPLYPSFMGTHYDLRFLCGALPCRDGGIPCER